MQPTLLAFTGLSVSCLLSFNSAALAAGKGGGVCVVSATADIYSTTSDKVEVTKNAGDCMACITPRAAGIFGSEYTCNEADGRIKVQYFVDKSESGMQKFGVVDAKNVRQFAYDCGCGSTPREERSCSPYSHGGFFKNVYNTCFKEAADRKRDDIGGGSPAPAHAASSRPAAEGALTNDDVLALVKVGLDDKLIVSKIQSAPSQAFDLSTDGLVSLKTAKVSDSVLAAMMKRADKK